MVSARLSVSATKKPVVCHPMVILMLFSPRQSNPPRLYPLARIGSTSMSRTELYSGGKALF